MKEKDMDNLRSGDVVVVVRIPKRKSYAFNTGDELVFDRYDFTIDTFYFYSKDNQQVVFGSSICNFLLLKSDYIKIKRNNKIDKILDVKRKN